MNNTKKLNRYGMEKGDEAIAAFLRLQQSSNFKTEDIIYIGEAAA